MRFMHTKTLPPMTGLFASLIQATSLASLVGVTEFFRIGQVVVERTTMLEGESPAFLIYGFVLVVYFVVCSCLSQLSRWLERRLAARGTRVVAARGAVDPHRGTRDVVLLFPNRQPRLRLIDDVPARLKRVPPMLRRNPHPHRHLAELQVAHAMHPQRPDQSKFFLGLRQNSFPFLFP